jgi:hypothetical protein
MRTLIKILFSTGGLIIIFVLGINLLGTRTDIVDDVTGDKIKQVKPGWNLEQVLATLGRPYNIYASQGLHDIICPNAKPRLEININNTTDIRHVVTVFYNDTNFCCHGNKEDLQTKEVTLTYTRPVKLSKYYPMLWVHLDSTFRVYSICAKQYDGITGIDDPIIYNMSWVFDATTMKMKNEIKSYIDERKFNDCFEMPTAAK